MRPGEASGGQPDLRATYVPDPAGPIGLARLVLTAPVGLAGEGELTLCFRDGRRVQTRLPAGQLRDVLRRWAAAARGRLGALEIGE